MPNYLKRMLAVGAAASLALGLAACGGGSDDDLDFVASTGGTGAAEAGGTLNYLQHYPFESADPQRIYYGLELANFSRTIYRSLVAFPITEDEVEAATAAPRPRDRHRHAERGRQLVDVHDQGRREVGGRLRHHV